MSVGDEWEEAKLAKQRASMTLDEWIDEVESEATVDWLVNQVADTHNALTIILTACLNADTNEIFNALEEVFGPIIEVEANLRMRIARDKYEEQYGRRV